MAKFVYRMQNVLEIKNKLETEAKMQYAVARAKLTEEEGKLEVIRNRKKDYETEGVGLRMDSLNIREITENRNAISTMDEYIKNQLIQVRIAEKNLEAISEKLQELRKDRKTHEKLREKAFEEFIKEQNALEGKEIDELTSYTYGQKKDE